MARFHLGSLLGCQAAFGGARVRPFGRDHSIVTRLGVLVQKLVDVLLRETAARLPYRFPESPPHQLQLALHLTHGAIEHFLLLHKVVGVVLQVGLRLYNLPYRSSTVASLRDQLGDLARN